MTSDIFRGITELGGELQETRATMRIKCNGVLFHVFVSAEDLDESPAIKAEFLQLLKGHLDPSSDASQQPSRNLFDFLLDAFAPTLQEAVPEVEVKLDATLYDVLHPKVLYYTMKVDRGELISVPSVEAITVRYMPTAAAPKALCQPFFSFRPENIQLSGEETIIAGGIYQKVVISGMEFFFKRIDSVLDHQIEHELKFYNKIREAKLEDDIRTSHLYGVVMDEKGLFARVQDFLDNSSGATAINHVFGLILNYIDCGGKTLATAVKSDTPAFLRRKWADQITHTITTLHDAGIAWGHPKPESILIDRDDNAWIMDFGGGYVADWVDPGFQETRPGDYQGLERIIRFINQGMP